MPQGWGCGPYYKHSSFFFPFKVGVLWIILTEIQHLFLLQTLAPAAFMIYKPLNYFKK